MSMSTSSDDQMRRAVAFVKAILDGDSAAHRALGPANPGPMEHLWALDPIRAAFLDPVAQDDHDLVTALCVLVISMARRPAMDDDALLDFLGRTLAVDP